MSPGSGTTRPPSFVSFAAAQVPSLRSSVRYPLGWLLRLHHGAASVTSKTDEEVMEEKKKRCIGVPAVFFFHSGKCSCTVPKMNQCDKEVERRDRWKGGFCGSSFDGVNQSISSPLSFEMILSE